MSNKNATCCPGRSIRVPEEIAILVEEGGGLDSICAAVPSAAALGQEASMHRAMSDRHRLIVLHALTRCDLCPCLLKSITGLADSKLSYHLAVLEGAGLISSRQLGQYRVYALTEDGRRATEAEKE
ncbi:MAG: metalloregulator ArsR/SmtB family transcription factor [Methanomassiliicoccales archaeon]